MNPSHLKCSLVLLFFSLTLSAFADKTEVEKRINKVFTIRPEGNLVVENRYGKIDVAIGEANKITIDVVIKARSGSLKKAQETLPDLVVMDVNMPGLNGFQVVQALKSSPKTAGIPLEHLYQPVLTASRAKMLVNDAVGQQIKSPPFVTAHNHHATHDRRAGR